MTTLAQHRRQEAVLTRPDRLQRGRLRALTTSAGSVQIRRQAMLVRITSIVEAHVSHQLVQRLESHVPPPRATILDDVYVRAEDKAIGNWRSMVDHYRRWFDIKITQRECPPWRRIEAMRNARNAVAHGLGELTRRMARRNTDQLKRDFATLGITITGSAIVITEESLRRAAFSACEFLEWLDEKLDYYDTRHTAGASP